MENYNNNYLPAYAQRVMYSGYYNKFACLAAILTIPMFFRNYKTYEYAYSHTHTLAK